MEFPTCQQLLMSLGADGLWRRIVEWDTLHLSPKTAQLLLERLQKWQLVFEELQTRVEIARQLCGDHPEKKKKDDLMKSWHLRKEDTVMCKVFRGWRCLTYWQWFSFLYFNKFHNSTLMWKILCECLSSTRLVCIIYEWYAVDLSLSICMTYA